MTPSGGMGAYTLGWDVEECTHGCGRGGALRAFQQPSLLQKSLDYGQGRCIGLLGLRGLQQGHCPRPLLTWPSGATRASTGA